MNNEDNMNNLTSTRLQLLTGLIEGGDYRNAVVILAIAYGTKAQHMEAREIIREEDSCIARFGLKNVTQELESLSVRRELLKTQILLSIAEKDLDLYRRVKECF